MHHPSAYEPAHPDSDSDIISDIRQTFKILSQNLLKNLQISEQEGLKIDDDFSTINKNFTDITELAQKYLRDQIKKPWMELDSK
jgi:hypothetical protein